MMHNKETDVQSYITLSDNLVTFVPLPVTALSHLILKACRRLGNKETVEDDGEFKNQLPCNVVPLPVVALST